MTSSIRDYLYLDIDRVRSIYAQASGGLTESFRELQQEIDSYVEEQEDNSESLSKNIMLGSGRVATRVLHDHLYTSVESKLSCKIADVTEDTISQIGSGALFRISGIAEIDDIERMLRIMENYNDMYSYLLAVEKASEIQDQVWDLQDQAEVEFNNSRNRANRGSTKKKANTNSKRTETELQLEELAPNAIAATVLRKRRAGISPLIPEAFRRIYGLLYKDIFEVKIITEFDNEKEFRGILNKEYLREDPTTIYAKYGTRPNVNLTMVGQVTTVMTPKLLGAQVELDTPEDESHSDAESDEERNLRDAFEALYVSVADVEEHLVRSSIRTSWIATPLAIFHEVS